LKFKIFGKIFVTNQLYRKGRKKGEINRRGEMPTVEREEL